jgi:hypothetical protein
MLSEVSSANEVEASRTVSRALERVRARASEAGTGFGSPRSSTFECY